MLVISFGVHDDALVARAATDLITSVRHMLSQTCRKTPKHVILPNWSVGQAQHGGGMATTAIHLRAMPQDLASRIGDWREQSFYDSFDGTYSQVNGVIHLTLYLEGEPYTAALDAMQQVEAKLMVRVVEVDRDLVTIGDVAERTGRSRESIRLLVEGKRGPGNFPTPVGSPGGVRVWDWSDVNVWLRSSVGVGDAEEALPRRAFFALNHWLTSRLSPASGTAS